jgi:putative membrane protein
MRPLTLLLGLLLLPLAVSAADREAALAKADVAFIQKAVVYNFIEVQAAQAALRRNLTAEERAYAEELVRQHSQANQELAALARQKRVEIATNLPSDRQEEIIELEGYQGTDFNERFLEERIDRHQQALRYLEDARDHSADADVRTYAGSGMIAVKRHLETAKQLEAKY